MQSNFRAVELQSAEDRKFDKNYFGRTSGLSHFRAYKVIFDFRHAIYLDTVKIKQ